MPYADPEVRREFMRQYRRKNKAKLAAAQPDHDRARHANQRARQYGVVGSITVRDVRAVLKVGVCHYCGSPDQLTIDHKEPMHAGGPNTRENLVACCRPCNLSKFRSDRPGRWSQTEDACTHCGTTERPHAARGMCSPCYSDAFNNRTGPFAADG